ncbi:MAG: AI-2E family transporter [Spirochaetes bacterium]|nr:AI-2E family transporter [Spirochaetota bacterium]
MLEKWIFWKKKKSQKKGKDNPDAEKSDTVSQENQDKEDIFSSSFEKNQNELREKSIGKNSKRNFFESRTSNLGDDHSSATTDYYDDQHIKRKVIFDREFLGLLLILVLLVLVSVLFFRIIRIFFTPILLALSFTTLFYPFYRFFLKKFGNNKNLSAFICCLLLLLILFIPVYFIGYLVTIQAIELAKIINAFIREGNFDFFTIFENIPFSHLWSDFSIDWKGLVLEGAKIASTEATSLLNVTFNKAMALVANLFIVLFTMFYFFRDGEEMVAKLIYLSPLRPIYERRIINRFVQISRATIKGTLVIGLIQGSIASVVLLIFGINGWMLWGVVMVILSIIPMVGTWMVMIPIAVFQLITGNYVAGIGIIVINTVIIANIDNLIRPRLIGGEAKIHDLMIFFSTIGGIAVFGIMGFIIGPIIAVLFITILDIYGVEFKATLTQKI